MTKILIVLLLMSCAAVPVQPTSAWFSRDEVTKMHDDFVADQVYIRILQKRINDLQTKTNCV